MKQNTPNIPPPQNTQDLRRIVEQYGTLLSPENKALITEVLQHIEQGADMNSLQGLVNKLQGHTQDQQAATRAPQPKRTARPSQPNQPNQSNQPSQQRPARERQARPNPANAATSRPAPGSPYGPAREPASSHRTVQGQRPIQRDQAPRRPGR